MTDHPEALRIAEQFESFAIDHAPNGWPAIQQRDLTNAAIILRHQQERIAELEAQVQALTLDSERYQFAIDSSIEYGRLNFKAIYDAWDGDGSFTDQIDAAIAAGKGEG